MDSMCSFEPSGTKGPIMAYTWHGDYLYWLEQGTTDASNNHNNDGVLARTKLGTWQREIILEGLNLFDARTFRYQWSLDVVGETIVWNDGSWSFCSANYYLVYSRYQYLTGFEKSASIRGNFPASGRCFGPDAAYRSEVDGLYALSFDGVSEPKLVISWSADSPPSCQVVGDHLYIYSHDYSSKVQGRASLASLTGDQPVSLEPATSIDGATLWTNGNGLLLTFMSNHGVGVTADGPDFDALSWKAVTRPADSIQGADSKYVYWAAGGTAYRSPLTGGAEQPTTSFGSDTLVDSKAAGSVIYRSRGFFEFVPMPAE
ncbi:MAG: hypothetical protein QM778_14000 [Myxococcales bacterium]